MRQFISTKSHPVISQRNTEGSKLGCWRSKPPPETVSHVSGCGSCTWQLYLVDSRMSSGDAPVPLPYASSVKVIFPYLNQDKFECFKKKIYYSETKVKENKDKDKDLSVSCPGSDPNIVEALLSFAFTAKAHWARCSAGFSRHIHPCLIQDARTRSSDFQPVWWYFLFLQFLTIL